MPTMLLTGPPRSGTTLLCQLLNEMPNAVALAEPMRPPSHGDVALAVAEVVAFAERMRAAAIAGESLPSKTIAGRVPSNFLDEPHVDRERRKIAVAESALVVDKPLSADFHLFVKHPAFFSALAKPLSARFPIGIILRNPLMVLASWQTVDMPIRDGHLPNAEAYRPELRAALATIADPLGRQIKIFETLLEWYRELDGATIVLYENLIDHTRATLGTFLPGAREPESPIYRYDDSRYQGVDIARLANALAPIARAIEFFYPDFRKSLERYV